MDVEYTDSDRRLLLCSSKVWPHTIVFGLFLVLPSPRLIFRHTLGCFIVYDPDCSWCKAFGLGTNPLAGRPDGWLAGFFLVFMLLSLVHIKSKWLTSVKTRDVTNIQMLALMQIKSDKSSHCACPN